MTRNLKQHGRPLWFATLVLFSCTLLQPENAFAKRDKKKDDDDKVASRMKVYISPKRPTVKYVAVMPFRAPTTEASMTLTEQFTKELEGLLLYTVVDADTVVQKSRRPYKKVADMSQSEAVQLGADLGVQAVVLGTLYRYGNVTEGKKEQLATDIELKLIDCITGDTIWSVKRDDRRDPYKTTLKAHAAVVAKKMYTTLVEQIAKTPAIPVDPKKKRSKTAKVGKKTVAPVVETSASIMDAYRPDPIRKFKIDKVDLREVKLRWGKPDGHPLLIHVERSTSPDGPFEVAAKLSHKDRRYTDHGAKDAPLKDGTTYYYRILSIEKNGAESERTEVLSAETPPRPKAPPSLQARVPGPREVYLEWKASWSTDITKYLIERADASKPRAFKIVDKTTQTEYRDGGTPKSTLEDSKEYIYRVRAVNRVSSVSEPSELVRATTLPRPERVQDFAAQHDQVRCVPLSWIANSVPSITGYKIFRSERKDGGYRLLETVSGKSATSYLDGGNDPGNLYDDKTYYYTIRAINTVEAESKLSPVVAATTRAIPAEVVGVEAQGGDARQVMVSWNPSSDGKVQGYEIWRSVADNGDFILAERLSGRDQSVFMDRGRASEEARLGWLLDDTLYSYRILAYNTAGTHSPWSKTAFARTKIAPMRPLSIRSTTDRPKGVVLAWDPNEEKDVIMYRIEYAGQPSGTFQERGTIDAPKKSPVTFVDDDLEDNTERFYRIVAIDETGLESEPSRVVQGQARQQPDVPRNLILSKDAEGAVLTWHMSEAFRIEKFRVWRKRSRKRELIATTEVPEYRMNREDFKRGGELSVSAIDMNGVESGRSSVVDLD